MQANCSNILPVNSGDEIFQIGTIVIAALTLVVNLHQSWAHGHFTSSCCNDDECFGMTFNNS